MLITALHLFLKLYHASYNHFLNSVQCFFAKLNWTKAGIDVATKNWSIMGSTRLGSLNLLWNHPPLHISLKYLSFDSETRRVITTKNNHFRSLVLVKPQKYLMIWKAGSRLVLPFKVTGDPGEFFLKSLSTVSFPSENYFQNFGENPNNSLTGLPQGGPSL